MPTVLSHVVGTIAVLLVISLSSTYFLSIEYATLSQAFVIQGRGVADYLASNTVNLVILASRSSSAALTIIFRVESPPEIVNQGYKIIVENVSGRCLIRLRSNTRPWLEVTSVIPLNTTGLQTILSTSPRNLTTRYGDIRADSSFESGCDQLVLWCLKEESFITVGIGEVE